MEEIMSKKRFEKIYLEQLLDKDASEAIDLVIRKDENTRAFATDFILNETVDNLAFSDHKFNYTILDQANFVLATANNPQTPGTPIMNYDNVSFVRQRIKIRLPGKHFFSFNTVNCGIPEDITINLIIKRRLNQYR